MFFKILNSVFYSPYKETVVKCKGTIIIIIELFLQKKKNNICSFIQKYRYGIYCFALMTIGYSNKYNNNYNNYSLMDEIFLYENCISTDILRLNSVKNRYFYI